MANFLFYCVSKGTMGRDVLSNMSSKSSLLVFPIEKDWDFLEGKELQLR